MSCLYPLSDWYRAICAAAEQHVMAAILREDEDAALAEAAFFERFSGIE